MKTRVKLYKNGIIFFGAAALALPLLFAGCEEFFTTSPLSWAQRDPSNLSTEQQIAYAEFALGSGDTQKLKDAYNAIKDSDDPEVQYLASQVAIGASGFDDALDLALSGETVTEQDIMDSLDGDWLNNSITSFDSAVAGGAEVASEDYLATSAAILVNSVKDGTFANLEAAVNDLNTDPPTDPDIVKAKEYIEASGYTTSDMDDLIGQLQ